MSIFSSRPGLRWLVPVAIAVAVVGGGTVVQTVAASAEPSLPDRSAAELLVDLQSAGLEGLSGTVRTNADLGLPSLPTGGGQGSSDLTGLVSGSRTLRVWYSGPDKARLALLGTLGESDVIRNGTDVWMWDSRRQLATHRQLSQQESDAGQPTAGALGRTPQEAAELALKAVDPSTVVRTGKNARVAGRAAYELILSPRDTGSLIGEVRLAIDATQNIPLRVQVFARGGGQPAYEVAFTQVSFARPDDAQFRFNPPPGTTVREAPAPGDQAGTDPATPLTAAPKIVGTGWTSVVVASVGTPTDGADAENAAATALLGSLPKVSGPWGSGRLVTSKLFSVLLTDDGRVIAGAVAPSVLYEAAGA